LKGATPHDIILLIFREGVSWRRPARPEGHFRLRNSPSNNPHGEHDFGSFELVKLKFVSGRCAIYVSVSARRIAFWRSEHRLPAPKNTVLFPEAMPLADHAPVGR
jgi:hypothetical protein